MEGKFIHFSAIVIIATTEREVECLNCTYVYFKVIDTWRLK